MSAEKDVGNGHSNGMAPSTSKGQFNYASAIFRSIKRQKLDPEKNVEEEKGDAAAIQDSFPDVATYEVDELREKAIEKLKQEAVRNADRAKTMGPRGW